ncbi:peptide-methionine (S)-S-oxide reductase MsrA [Candidatus Pacearchaeota archaeon]|nr:peptide-methionine (S)-S-oxide reductase MsrA [Candidatus Pacearchaeota archaeon]
MKIEKAMFGAGCFWGVQYTFQKIPGVLKTEVGYSGGNIKNPSYEEVCNDKSGHAEVVYIEFDPEKVSYADLLSVFWKSHNPTTINMQWPDVGTQYRSIIFYYSTQQKKEAEESLKRVQKIIPKKIVTEIKKASEFYPAENYHQDYVNKNGANSCHIANNPYLS